jgi:hypothetical protein
MTMPHARAESSIPRAQAMRPLRILAVSHTWEGANDYSFVRAFRRAGHSVLVASDEGFVPQWNSPPLKVARRILLPVLVADYERHLIRLAKELQPDLFFVFKGTFVTARAIDAARRLGAVAINYYPDIGFDEHGPHISKAMSHYDWIFTTKSFRVDYIRRRFAVAGVSFLPHAFDPEVHHPRPCDEKDRARYLADVSFVGTWSPKKEQILLSVRELLPDVKMRIWGNQWERAHGSLRSVAQFQPVLGGEYAKALQLARINLALLVEKRPDSEDGDLITSRTFNIPAVGGFMLHERNAEVEQYFVEGRDCAMFEGTTELIEKIRYYLGHPEERDRIAAAGLERCLTSGYSVDDRVGTIVGKVLELRSKRAGQC